MLFVIAVFPASENSLLGLEVGDILCSAAKFFAPKRISLRTVATERKIEIASSANKNATQPI